MIKQEGMDMPTNSVSVQSQSAVHSSWLVPRIVATTLLLIGLNLAIYIFVWQQPAPNLEPGDMAVDFQVSSTTGEYQLSRQPAVLINFVSTECTACLDEIAILDGWRRTPNIVIWIVAADEFSATDWRDKNFPIMVDSKGVVADAYHIVGYPASVLVQAGVVKDIRYGGPLTLEQFTNFAGGVFNGSGS